MAKGIYVQRGESIDFKNTGNADIGYDEVVSLSGRIGIAGTDIPIGTTGSLHVIGVFDLPADKSEALDVGQEVYWTGECITSTVDGNVRAGWVVAPKNTTGDIARVKIG